MEEEVDPDAYAVTRRRRPDRPASANARIIRSSQPRARACQGVQGRRFDYDLPLELIAQARAPERIGSRLVHVDGLPRVADLRFVDLPGLLRPGDFLEFNDTRAFNAPFASASPPATG